MFQEVEEMPSAKFSTESVTCVDPVFLAIPEKIHAHKVTLYLYLYYNIFSIIINKNILNRNIYIMVIFCELEYKIIHHEKFYFIFSRNYGAYFESIISMIPSFT